MAVTVTKLEAASRQLDMAIRLFFTGGDAISVHTLAVAAANIFADVAEHRNAGVSWRTRTRDDSGLSTGELKRIYHEEWNFFKHADRDPESTLTFNDLISEDVIFMAVLDCGDLQCTTCPMQAFQLWYIAAHAERFPRTEQVFADAQQALPGLSQLERSQQIQRGTDFLEQHCARMGRNERGNLNMETNTTAHREPAAVARLLVRSALLGALVPVMQGEFWQVKAVQVIAALVLCLVLLGLEKVILWPFRKRPSAKPLYLAAYRGAALYGLLILGTSGDWAQTLGAAIGGALAGLLLFKLEKGIVKLLAKRSSAGSPS